MMILKNYVVAQLIEEQHFFVEKLSEFALRNVFEFNNISATKGPLSLI